MYIYIYVYIYIYIVGVVTQLQVCNKMQDLSSTRTHNIHTQARFGLFCMRVYVCACVCACV